jgi:hypothetical protein
MFNLTQSQIGFIAGVGALWVLSALAGALTPPTAQSSQGYTIFFKFFKTIVGDLGSVFGKYLPPAGTGALVALLCISLCVLPVVGCTQQQKISVAQEIVNWTPVLVSTADTVNASIEALDPATTLILGPLTLGINALAPEVEKAAQAYLANPNQTTLQVLQAVVTQIQQDVSTALLSAAKITNPASQATATKDVNLVATIINTILAMVQSISTKAQVAAMASHVQLQLALVRPYMDRNAMQAASVKVSHDLALDHAPTVDQFFAYEAQAGF